MAFPNSSQHFGHWKTAARMAVGPFALSRLWVALWVYVGHANHRYLAPIGGGWRGIENWWLNPWTTYDSLHYLSIARDGYAPKSIAFFPFYPALLQLFRPDFVTMACWGIFISNIGLALGLVVLFRLTQFDFDARIARRTLWLVAFFPQAVFFGAVYTEGVFLLAIVSAFWCVRTRQFAWAGFWALIAALTRNSGPLLFLALLAFWWQSRPQVLAENEKAHPQVLAGQFWTIGAPILAFVWVQQAQAARFGALAGLNVQKLYFRAATWPWIPVWRDGLNILSGRTLDFTTLLDFSCCLVAPLLVWKFRRQIPLGYAILVLGVIAMNLLYARQIPPYTVATSRYLMTMFPFAQLLAAQSVSWFPVRRQAIIALVLLAFLCALQALQFGMKNFLG